MSEIDNFRFHYKFIKSDVDQQIVSGNYFLLTALDQGKTTITDEIK
jgi:hypothetical protein